MLRRQKHVLSQSATPFACTLFYGIGTTTFMPYEPMLLGMGVVLEPGISKYMVCQPYGLHVGGLSRKRRRSQKLN